MVEWGTWYPYTGNNTLLLAFVLLVAVILLVYAGKRLRIPIAVKRPGRAVSCFLILLWLLSIYTFFVALYVYGVQLVQVKLLGTSPVNNITPITLVSAAVSFLVILYLTRKYGWKIALGSAFVGAAAGPMVFELPFDIIVMNMTYPPILPYPVLYRELFFFPLFIVEILTFSLLTLSPAMKVSKYTAFSLAGMFFVFAVWALFGFAYGATGTDPLLYAFNAVSKALSFITIITLFVSVRLPSTTAYETTGDIQEGRSLLNEAEGLTEKSGEPAGVGKLSSNAKSFASSSESPLTESEPVIEVQHLVKRYGAFTAVNDVSLSIREGEIFGIIGPNGAGKTTTVECISGLRVPDSGSISIRGLSPHKDRDKIREFLGVQLQESAMPPRLKVGEAVELFASFYSNSLDPDGLLETLGIKNMKNSSYRKLSGGQKQRLSIALALVGNPKIAILDELTTGLDPEARRETWDLIESIRDRGVTVILVTHFMDEAERLCDRLALINHGKLVVLDTPEAIAAQAGESRVRFVPSKRVDDKTLYAIPGVKEIERKEAYVTIVGTGDLAASIIYSLADIGVHVSDIEAKGGNLDDAFVKLTREDKSKGQEGTHQS